MQEWLQGNEALKLTPLRPMSLEQCLEFVANDELVEITPLNIRMRKRILDSGERKRASSKSNK
jgi:GTP-binding protein